MIARHLHFLVGALLLTTGANAEVIAPSAAASYAVSFALSDDGRIIGKPRLTVKLGRPVSMEVSGPDGYRLELLVEKEAPSSTRTATSGLLVRSRLYRPDGAGWKLVADPALTLAQGEQARVSIDGVMLEIRVDEA